MGGGLDGEVLVHPLKNWVATEHRECSKLRRLEVIEQMIDYWVPISRERDIRLDEHERRIAALERAAIPPGYTCLSTLADQIDRLAADVRELYRRLNGP